MLRYLLSLFVAVPMFGIVSVELSVGDDISAEKQQALTSALDEWSPAFASHDAAALASRYTEDVLMILPDGTKLKGRPAVQKFFEKLLKNHPNLKNSGEDVFYHKLAPGVVMEDGIWEESGHSSPINWTRGRYVVTLVYRDGDWLVSHERGWVLVEATPAAK